MALNQVQLNISCDSYDRNEAIEKLTKKIKAAKTTLKVTEKIIVVMLYMISAIIFEATY